MWSRTTRSQDEDKILFGICPHHPVQFPTDDKGMLGESKGLLVCFFIEDPDTSKAIQDNNQSILEILNFILDSKDEVWLTGKYSDSHNNRAWDIPRSKDKREKLKEEMSILLKSNFAENWQRRWAKEILEKITIEEEGIPLPKDCVPNIDNGISTLLKMNNCQSGIQFYRTVDDVPKNSPGIYLLYKDQLLDYIGEATNIKNRLIRSHNVYNKANHIIGIISIKSKKKRKAIEIAMIGALSPEENKMWNYKKQENE